MTSFRSMLPRRALDRRVSCRSFYLDLNLLEDFWVRRKYHHTISAPLVYALDAALGEVLDEGLAVRVPAGTDEAAVRTQLRQQERIEIGAGLGPLAGKIWRVGLMGYGAVLPNADRAAAALTAALASTHA